MIQLILDPRASRRWRRQALAWTSALLTVATVSGARVALSQAVPNDAGESLAREDVERREDYFWRQRTYPGTIRPYEAMTRLRLEAFARRMSPSRISAAGLGAGTWRALGPAGLFGPDNGYFQSGPQLDAGRVTGILPSATAGGPLLIATASGGVWRAAFNGTGWEPRSDDQCSLNTGAIARDPVNPAIVYVGTGEFNVNSVGCGILRSADGGTSWTLLGANAFLLNGGGSAGFAQILVDHATAGTLSSTTILAASNVGVFRSTNSGASWSYVLSGATGSIVAHPSTAGVFFAGQGNYNSPALSAVYRSADAGATWTALPLPADVAASSIRRIELATSAAAPDMVFALIVSSSSYRLRGLYRWDDRARQWSTLAATGLYSGDPRGDFGAQGWYNLAMALDPADARRIYVAGLRAYLSTDGGASFVPMANEIHCDWHSIVVDPVDASVVYAGTDGGVFISQDRGQTWKSRNAGLAITQYYPGIAVLPQGTMIMGGSQDNGTQVYTGSSVWDSFLGGDGGYAAINPADPNIVYGEAEWFGGPHIFRRDSRAYSQRTTGISAQDRALFIPPLVMDPVTPTTLYFGTQRLYQTIDEGTHWAAISSDLSRGSGAISTIAVAPSDPTTIYVGTTDGLAQVSRNRGSSWTLSVAGLPNRYVTRIVVDPIDATHSVLTMSGFGGGHVFETVNAGASWQNITGTLIDAPTNVAAIIPGTGVLVVGTDVGVFQTADHGVTWQAGPAGLPNAVVYDLVYTPSTAILVAGTYGRGMFAYNVGAAPVVLRGDANADGKIDAFDALLIQQSVVGVALPGGAAIYPRGDANCNGSIDSADALLVLRNSVGLATPDACVGTTK